MENQEQFMKMQMLGQEAEKIDQQIQAIDQQITEMNAVKESITNLESNKNKDREILANLGKGVFVKAELKGNDFFVNVGKEVLLKKNGKDLIKIFDEQITRLNSGKEEFNLRIAQLQMEMQGFLADMQEAQAKKSEGHSCGGECEHDDCECEEPCEDCSCEHEHSEEEHERPKAEKKNKKK